MRFLKKSQINPRNIADNSVAIQIDGEVTMDTTNVLLLPKGTDSERPLSPVNGHIRYNTTLNEVEVYQAGTWRSLRFKEPIGIIQELVGVGDGSTTVFGPIDVDPAVNVDSSTSWSANGNPTTPGNVWTGANILVIVGNVIQIYNTNYIIEDGAAVGGIVGKKYITFTSAVPGLNTEIYALHGFDR
jgi:hypothetical protein